MSQPVTNALRGFVSLTTQKLRPKAPASTMAARASRRSGEHGHGLDAAMQAGQIGAAGALQDDRQATMGSLRRSPGRCGARWWRGIASRESAWKAAAIEGHTRAARPEPDDQQRHGQERVGGGVRACAPTLGVGERAEHRQGHAGGDYPAGAELAGEPAGDGHHDRRADALGDQQEPGGERVGVADRLVVERQQDQQAGRATPSRKVVAAADAKPRWVNSRTSISASLPQTTACQMNPATSPSRCWTS